jgi:hypothetical protein
LTVGGRWKMADDARYKFEYQHICTLALGFKL